MRGVQTWKGVRLGRAVPALPRGHRAQRRALLVHAVRRGIELGEWHPVHIMSSWHLLDHGRRGLFDVRRGLRGYPGRGPVPGLFLRNQGLLERLRVRPVSQGARGTCGFNLVHAVPSGTALFGYPRLLRALSPRHGQLGGVG